MKLRPVILIALIIVLPLAALTWTVLRLAENEQIVLQQRYRALMEDRLQDINASVSVVFEDMERELSSVAAIDNFDITKLRETNHNQPRLLQLFVLNPQGQLAYPNPSGELNASERMFLIQAAKMFTGQDLKEAVARAEQDTGDNRKLGAFQADKQTRNFLPPVQQQEASRSSPSQSTLQQSIQLPDEYASQNAEPRQQQTVKEIYAANTMPSMDSFEESSGWFIWYWDRGLNLIYWQRRPSGHVVGCALERARWMADLIAQLPETVNDEKDKIRSVTTRVRLVNSSAASVYQWGKYEPPEDARPLCEVPLAVPLASWRLQCFVPSAQLTTGTGRGVYLSLLTGLIAVILALTVSAFFFIREYARDMREASQQVSFVNQVSHELKTPLTNIRMYAELLDTDLDKIEQEDAKKPRERLGIILSEGQRLSRLISNVLTFARQKRKTLQLQPREERPCRLINQIVDRFRPAFTDQQINIDVNCTDSGTFSLDPDFLEQILGNLISNVEKYAASGGLLKIGSSIENNILTIDVTDAGPGIDSSKQQLVFEPFARVSNDVSYAAGTGIGLPIARELARLHGGDLNLLKTQTGCCFRATLKNQSQS